MCQYEKYFHACKKYNTMKSFILFILLVINLTFSNAQNNIGIGTQTPHASALLDVSSTNKGIMAPRMTTAQRNAIASPAKGLLVYDMDLNGLYHYNGSAWAVVGAGGGGGAFSLPYEATTNLNTDIFKITNSGSGDVIKGITSNEFGRAVVGIANSAGSYGIYGYTNGEQAVAVYGDAGNGTALKGYSVGGLGVDARSANNTAIRASIILGANANPALLATHAGAGIGVDASSNTGTAVRGTSNASTGALGGVVGINNNGTGGNGVMGIAHAANSAGVNGVSNNGTGVWGYSNENIGVRGGTISGTALFGNSTSGYGLEVVGKVKISGGNTNPVNGAVLTSIDASGNAVWKPNRVAFGVTGINSIYELVPNNSARRVQFYGTDLYDLTQSYTPLVGNNTYNPASSSTYAIPVTGVYHFDVSVELFNYDFNDAPDYNSLLGSIVLKLNRNGNVSSIAENIPGERSIFSDSFTRISFTISRDFSLNAGDRLYVEVEQSNNAEIDFVIVPKRTYFTGHLVTPL
jgi:hypothetical protein